MNAGAKGDRVIGWGPMIVGAVGVYRVNVTLNPAPKIS